MLTLGALGVVFGDIGTSPLYALQTVFSPDGGAVGTDKASVYGVISMVFWAITLVVSVKYVTFIMRADDQGEGGIMALTGLVNRASLRSPATKATLVALGLLGAALFFADGMITPAISVLSAVEGLQVVSPSLERLILPLTLVVLTALFAIQRFGTGAVGGLFGPVTGLWFLALGIGGLAEVIREPRILEALSPSFAVTFMVENGGVAFVALASVVLVVTGAEALYADMGHFGRPAIRRAWFFAAFPALTLQYLGQGALILRDPQTIKGTLFLLYPDWLQIPMVMLATAETVIASQALISGAFSISRQAVQMGVVPRLAIRHTSEGEVGQVFIPAINWILFAGVVALVLAFGSSSNLASAYGVAVTGTFVLTTLLFLVVVRTIWTKPLWLVVLAGAFLLTIDLAFFTASLGKIATGGWLPLVIAAGVYTVLRTWQNGRKIVTANRIKKEGPLRDFVHEIHAMRPPVHRVPGTAIFLNVNPETAPLALRANVEHNRTLHESVVILTVVTEPVAYYDPADRLTIDDLGYRDDGITHLTGRYGFQEQPDIPQLLASAQRRGVQLALDPEDCSYYLSRINLVRTDAPVMPGWRKRLFIALSRTSANPVEYFVLPAERTVVMGGHIDI